LGKDISDIYTDSRDRNIQYLGHQVSVPVASPLEEYNIMAWAALKEWAIVKGRIPPIWGELGLVDYAELPRWRGAFEIEDSVFVDVVGVRRVAASYVKETFIALQIKGIMGEHSGFLRQMDKRFKIEVAFFELMIDVGADRLLQAEVKSCLPSGLAK
jgi:hypothetical protein